MDNVKILFGSVIYNSALDYWDNFIESINNQTCSDFELLLLNDDIPEIQMKSYADKIKVKHCIIPTFQKYSPIQLRIELLRQAKQRNSNLLIIGDCDDYFSKNRVDKILNSFLTFRDTKGFFYNEIITTNGQRTMPELPQETNDIEQILEQNYLGLSNTAINMHYLTEKFINSLTECTSMIFDWYFYSRILLCEIPGIKVSDCYTYYRYHDNNLVGNQVASEEGLKNEKTIKINHYSMLEKYDVKFSELKRAYITNKIKKNIHPDVTYWWNFLKEDKS